MKHFLPILLVLLTVFLQSCQDEEDMMNPLLNSVNNLEYIDYLTPDEVQDLEGNNDGNDDWWEEYVTSAEEKAEVQALLDQGVSINTIQQSYVNQAFWGCSYQGGIIADINLTSILLISSSDHNSPLTFDEANSLYPDEGEWRLPSSTELTYMYNQLYRTELVAFNQTYHTFHEADQENSYAYRHYWSTSLFVNDQGVSRYMVREFDDQNQILLVGKNEASSGDINYGWVRTVKTISLEEETVDENTIEDTLATYSYDYVQWLIDEGINFEILVSAYNFQDLYGHEYMDG